MKRHPERGSVNRNAPAPTAEPVLVGHGLNSWLMAAVILALVIASYAPAIRGGLVWDDAAHVTRPDLQSWAGLGRIWSDLHATQQYYPVLHSAFWLEHRLWGDAPIGYHGLNLLLHVGCCCLLAGLLRQLWASDLMIDPKTHAATRRGGLGGAEWLAAALFAVHPVMVESVAWISEQKNTLSLLFYLSAAAAYWKFVVGRRWRWYVTASGFFLLALGTKSVTATLPAALLVVIGWKRGRIELRRDVAPLLPWLGVGMTAGLFTAWVERNLIGAQGAAFDLTFLERGLLASRLIWFYLGKLFWPAELSFVYPRWAIQTDAFRWVGYLVGVIAVTVGLWLIRRRSRGPLAAWLYFVGSLFPALGFFNVYPFVFSYAADHFQYLASIGIIVLVAVGGVQVLRRGSRDVRIGGAVGMLALVVGLVVITRQQARTYRDGETLYRATLALNPDSWMAHNNLAVQLASAPAGVEEALLHYREALRLKPDSAEAHNNFGNTLAGWTGQRGQAIDHFQAALRINPRFSEAHLNLANALADIPERVDEARPHYVTALQLNPGWSDAHYSYANFLARDPGRLAEAMEEYEAALRLRPDFPEAHANLGQVLALLPDRRAEAEAHYQEALRLAPAQAITHYNYALLLEETPDRLPAAMAEYTEALRLNPRYAKAHNNLATLYARQRRYDLARLHWEKAVELNPDDEDPRRNLARLNQQQAVR
ncbi:MAG: tetratricopeptide repeat protein [Opitutus sp.]